MLDFFSTVKTDFSENIQRRYELRKYAAKDPVLQRDCIDACKEDVLFFFSVFCWLYEPRPRYDDNGMLLPKQIPFIPWEHQIPIIRAAEQSLGVRDIGITKSRGEGMSWIGVLLAVRDWLFDDMAKIGLVSNTEKKADDPGNMDSLGAKIDWELTKLPKWMVGIKDVDWKRNISDHSWVNRRNEAQLNAFAATADAGRAGRYKWFLADEIGFWDTGKDSEFVNAIRSSTDSRLFISTPNGTSGEYYKLIHTPSNMLKLTLHWSQNRSKNRGLYRFVGGKPVAVDPVNNPLPPHYNPPSQEVLDQWSRLRAKGFKLDDPLKDRSPWYDNECDRADATPFSIAQELDLDFGGSMYKVFGPDFFVKADKSVQEPVLRGVMDYNKENLDPDFQATGDGPVLLWTQLNARGKPPEHRYVVGADVAAGTGGSFSSNSTCIVLDAVMCEQVLEWATNTVEPGDWAEFCIAICKWFHNAYLIWEHNGPTGAAFTKRVLDKGYANIYYRTSLSKRGRKKTKSAGWYTTDGNDGTKGVMFSSVRRAVVSGGLLIRSRATVRECAEYVWLNGKIVNIHTASNEDESAAGAAHGDRVIGLCVANQGLEDRPLPQTDRQVQEISPHTMAGRMKAYEDSLRQDADDWDDRSNWDLMRVAPSTLLDW